MKIKDRSPNNSELYRNIDFNLNKSLSVITDNDLNNLIGRIINNKKIYLAHTDEILSYWYQYDYTITTDNKIILKKILFRTLRQSMQYLTTCCLP